MDGVPFGVCLFPWLMIQRRRSYLFRLKYYRRGMGDELEGN